MIVPQPIIRKIPFLLTNEDVRIAQALKYAKGKLLDIGCGENRLVGIYRDGGGVGVGVDVYNWGGGGIIVKDTSCLPFADQTFDTITFVACLNHIPNREKVLEEACRLLAEDGRVILTNLSPFVSWIWHKWAFWDKDQHERGMKDEEIWGFTITELSDLLKASGLQIDVKEYFSIWLNQLYVCQIEKRDK